MSAERSSYFGIFCSKNKTNDSAEKVLNNKLNAKKKLATFDLKDDDCFDQRPKTTKPAIKIKSVYDLFESEGSEPETRIDECNFKERTTTKKVNKEFKIPTKSKDQQEADSNKEKSTALEYIEILKKNKSQADLKKSPLKEDTNDKSSNALKEKSLNRVPEQLKAPKPLIDSYFEKNQVFLSSKEESNTNKPKKLNRNQVIKELDKTKKEEKSIETKSKTDGIKKEKQISLEDTINTANRKDMNKAFEYMTKLKSKVQTAAIPTVEELEEQEQEEEKRRILEANREGINKIMAYVQKVNADKLKNPVKSSGLIVLDSESDSSSPKRLSPKRKEFERDSEDEDRDSNEEDEENKAQHKLNRPRRQYEYVAIEENELLDSQIDDILGINLLNEAQIEYMVLRDINYYIDIFSGNCEHSWRHLEYKKYSKKSGNLLYSNAALSSYTLEQYTTAVTALQSIFCKKNNKCDEYIIKVLLPEALIKICMRIYQCSKEAAEDFLQHDNFKNNFEKCPQGSAVRLTNRVDL